MKTKENRPVDEDVSENLKSKPNKTKFKLKANVHIIRKRCKGYISSFRYRYVRENRYPR